jgi:hypothetical protein
MVELHINLTIDVPPFLEFALNINTKQLEKDKKYVPFSQPSSVFRLSRHTIGDRDNVQSISTHPSKTHNKNNLKRMMFADRWIDHNNAQGDRSCLHG